MHEHPDTDIRHTETKHLNPRELLGALSALPDPEGPHPVAMLSTLLEEHPELEPYRDLIGSFRERKHAQLDSHQAAAVALGVAQLLRLQMSLNSSEVITQDDGN